MESHSVSRAQGILLVGGGFIADAHVAAIAATPGVELAGVVDTDAARAAAYAHRNGGVRWSADLAEALAWPGVDAVIVCTPNFTHVSIGTAVARAGKHLLVEKPLATTVADARKLIAEFERADRVLMAAHTHRSYDYARTVRSALADGDLGSPRLVRLAVLGGWIWPDWSAWVLDPQRSGGHALHNGVHLLDLVCWWLDAQPRTVYARGQKQTSGELGIHDHLEMVLTLADGATAVCEMSRAHRPGSFGHRDVLVVGTDGVLELGWADEASLVVDERGTGLLPAAGNDGFAVQLRAWLDAIGGAAPAMTPDDALAAVAMGVAVERSIATGRPVELAEVLAA